MSLFARFEKKHRMGIDCRFLSEARLDEMRTVLPSGIVDFWSEFGLCGYSKGLFWMTDPNDLRDALELWLPHPEGYLCFCRTAFADLFLWDGSAIRFLDCQTGMMFDFGARAFVFFENALCSDDFLRRVVGRGIHEAVVERLGAVSRDECYAFEPVLAMGGSGAIESVAKVKLREHIALLADVIRQEAP